MPKEVGRPVKINPTIQAELVKMIQAGNYMETAAAFVGISISTMRDWIRRGEREAQRFIDEPRARPIKSETPFLEFSAAIKKAQAAAEIRDVIIIGDAARESWQAAAWRLDRKYPEKWGRKDRHEVSGPSGGPVQIEEIREKLFRKFSDIKPEPEQKQEGTD